MEAQLEQLEGDRVRLTVEVPASEVHHAVEHATHDLADRVRVPGFRAGKVPPRGARSSGSASSASCTEAVESHIGSWFWSAARTQRVRPTEQPAYEYELPSGADEAWQFTAEFPVQPPVEPADWTTLEVPRLEVEVPDEVVDGQLQVLQQGVASLSPVEGRPARPGRRRRHRHRGRRRARASGTTSSRSGRSACSRSSRTRSEGSCPGDSDEVTWEVGDGSTRPPSSR